MGSDIYEIFEALTDRDLEIFLEDLEKEEHSKVLDLAYLIIKTTCDSTETGFLDRVREMIDEDGNICIIEHYWGRMSMVGKLPRNSELIMRPEDDM